MTPEEKKAYKTAPEWVRNEFKARKLKEAAPQLLKACKLALTHMRHCDDHESESASAGADAITALEYAIKLAEPN